MLAIIKWKEKCFLVLGKHFSLGDQVFGVFLCFVPYLDHGGLHKHRQGVAWFETFQEVSPSQNVLPNHHLKFTYHLLLSSLGLYLKCKYLWDTATFQALRLITTKEVIGCLQEKDEGLLELWLWIKKLICRNKSKSWFFCSVSSLSQAESAKYSSSLGSVFTSSFSSASLFIPWSWPWAWWNCSRPSGSPPRFVILLQVYQWLNCVFFHVFTGRREHWPHVTTWRFLEPTQSK